MKHSSVNYRDCLLHWPLLFPAWACLVWQPLPQSGEKEIGVRKVLGATVPGIAALISKDFLKLVAVACVLAFPVAWWMMNSWLLNYQYRISISWWIFFVAGAAAILIAICTVSYQAIKAAFANPVKSLRTE